MIRDAGTPPFTQIGLITQSHGLKGELKMIVNDEFQQACGEWDIVYLRTERGDFYPARIQNIRRQDKGNKFLFFVQFEHIADKVSAESLKNNPVFLRTEDAELLFDEAPESSLLNYDVYTTDLEHYGIVTEVRDNIAQQILVISGPKGSILVPLVDFYVVTINHDDETITGQNLHLLEDL